MLSANRIDKFDTKVLALIVLTIVSVASETIIGRVYLFLNPGPSSVQLNLALFTFGVLLFAIVQVLLIRNLNGVLKPLLMDRQNWLKSIFNLLKAIQFGLMILLFVLLYQIIANLSYNPILMITIICLTYLFAIINLAILSERFIKWSINNRTYVSIAFGISTISILANSILTVFFVTFVLLGQPTEIKLHFGILIPPITSSLIPLKIFYSTSFLISYLVTWFTTLMIIYNYSKKIGRIKFWVLVTLPMIYVVGEFQVILLPFFRQYLYLDPVFFTVSYTIFFGIVKLAAAVFFGIGLWVMARKIEQESLKGFLRLSAYGLMLIFVSNQTNLLLGSLFPPIGLLIVCFVGLAAFLLLSGTYSAAIYVANDITIRKSIRKSVKKEFELLGNIGTSEMTLQLNKKILSKVNSLSAHLKENTGIESSLTQEDIKDYTREVVEEISRNKTLK